MLASVDDRVTFTWAELDKLVGGLPQSAYDHSAFWKGSRSGWPGFTTVDVEVNRSVTFVHRAEGSRRAVRRTTAEAVPRRRPGGAAADVVLVGCVKTKLDRSAPARDLYTSPLFRKQRSYAEVTGAPWFVLSTEHGLALPTTVLRPYDRRLSTKPREYRRKRGERVVDQLKAGFGPLAAKVVEVHAGAADADAVRGPLQAEGAEVLEPLQGLRQGERLAWYGGGDPTALSAAPSPLDVSVLAERLGTHANAITPADLLATGGAGLRLPGLCSRWVDRDGASALTVGLEQSVEPGLIYAGLAGATRSRSGRPSRNTLWKRIEGTHLGGRHEFSTFRLSLGSVLARAHGTPEIDENHLTAWMHRHLRVVTVPVNDTDTLERLETAVLAALDPPLNLSKMAARTRARTAHCAQEPLRPQIAMRAGPHPSAPSA
ncbi:DUF6884 domain-containing protein [Nocardiopsis sp. LOL_012]|uniref:DUF6884 domain-containing protein n=1 Tax=Nocardiopsis sp. LOL_012 TaxID=3345409 RepID=UPI003A8A47C3